jgi:2-dehydro-3-deoxyphosphooctonate aldolase (KDO 8-P synthase)
MFLNNLANAQSGQFFLIAGPCVVENEKVVFEIAEYMIKLTDELKIPYIFKASYRKANRSKVKAQLGVPVLTDIHTEEEAALAAQYVDVLQIPAFLCRQTSLLIAAANTQKVVNIKKGQFLSPQAMQFAIEKVRAQGNTNVWATERGVSFGYTDLIVDFRGIPIIQDFGVPVVLDCTHSVQQPNQAQGVTGGLPRFIETLACAGIAAGTDGIFIETHPQPEQALSDGANMMQLQKMDKLLTKLAQIRKTMLTFAE